jgi:glucose/mannose transport system substrate-binding protein
MLLATGRLVGQCSVLCVLAACLCGCGDSGRTQTIESDSTERPSLEVMHWLTSDRDSAALKVLREGLMARGGIWRDSPMPGAGDTGRRAVITRIVGGKPPDVFQFSVGAALEELVAENLVATVPSISSDAEASMPLMVRRVTRHEGRRIALPIAVRGENWLFYNAAVLREAHVAVPRTWGDFMNAAAALKSAGKTPIALGGQPWQERILFNAVLLGIGGRDFHRKVYEQLDRAAIESQTMLQIFQAFSTLRAYVDPGSPGRRWHEAANLLVRADAAFLFMGDWAKSEFLAAGLRLGEEIGCELTPANEEAYVMMVDAFVFSPTKEPAARAAQVLLARTLQDPAIQVQLARKMGTIPANTSVPDTDFDECSEHALEVVRDARAQLLEPGLSLPAGLAGAIDDSISRFWNSPGMSPQQGHSLLVETIASQPGH